MSQSNIVPQLRQRLHERLSSWIPDNERLVNKELSLFDSLMSRRDFIKTTSFAAIAALINTGCSDKGHSGAPSQWSEFSGAPTLVGAADQSSVPTASRIVVDADIMDAIQAYKPLPALGSDDATGVKDNAVLESFNPHIVTTDSSDTIPTSGLNPIVRNYGVAEFVHLIKQDGADYSLSILEDSNDGHHGLKETVQQLQNTASQNFNNLIAANGTFHNRAANGLAYSQKMALVANVGDDFNYNDAATKSMYLYYQQNSNALLQPGVEFNDNGAWTQLDVMKVFTDNEKNVPFKSYRIVEVDNYHDGSNHSFLFGTIQFDKYYNYGFVITFNTVTDSAPTVTFFAPHYLSVKYDTLNTFISDFEKAKITSDKNLSDFTVFKGQLFRPLSQMVGTDGSPTGSIMFSFFSPFVKANTTASRIYFDNSDHISFNDFTTTDSTILHRYIISVPTASAKGVQYLLSGYSPTMSVKVQPHEFVTIVFDPSSMPVFDIWKDLYAKNNNQFVNSFARFIKNDGTNVTISLATSYYDQASLGVTHKTFAMTPNGDGFTLSGSITTANTLLENTSYTDTNGNSKDYKALWFEDMKGHLNNNNTLAECVKNDNGVLEFHCTHNSQGLLRSYYIVRSRNTDNTISSFLIGFNEQGATDPSVAYDSQNHENLINNINSNSVSHYPPMPIAVDAQKIHSWYPMEHDGEALYTGTRSKITDSVNKVLLPNDGTQGSLQSYNHAKCDSLEGIWNMNELEKQVQPGEYANNNYSITNHQVHLHTTNIYGTPVALSGTMYVELRFAKPATVRDYTDPANPKTYNATRLKSLFVRPDAAGRVSLEVDVGGSKDDKYAGATMMYRFVDSSALTLNANTPVATAGTSGNTTAFQQCNISFKAFDRLSGTVQSGADKTAATINAKLTGNINSDKAPTIPTITSAFGKMRDKSQPDNGTPTQNARFLQSSKNSRGGVLGFIFGNTATPIDPLTFVPLLNGGARSYTQERSLRGILNPSKQKRWFWSHWHPIQWISHALKTVVSAFAAALAKAKAIADAIKAAINKVVADIDTIVTNIATSIADAAVSLAAAISKISLASIISFAESVWEFIKMLLDMGRCFAIGQELKQLFHDQFDSASTVPKNAYSLIKNQTATIQKSIDGAIDGVKGNIDKAIDSALGNTDKLNTQRDDSVSRRQNSQAGSTKTSHITDQISRVSASNSSSSVSVAAAASPSSSSSSSLAVCSSNPTLEQLMLCLGSGLAQATIDGLMQTSNDIGTTVSDMFSGKDMADLKDDFAKTLKDMVNFILNDAKIIADGAVQLPLAFLNGSSIADAILQALDPLEQLILEALGLLFFQNANKFQTMEDFGYFIIGFFINIVDVVLGGLITFKGAPLDIGNYIQNGSFRNAVNHTANPRRLSTNARIYRDTTVSSTPTDDMVICIMGYVDGIDSALINTFDVMRSLRVGGRLVDQSECVVVLSRMVFAFFSAGANIDKGFNSRGTADIFNGIGYIYQFAAKMEDEIIALKLDSTNKYYLVSTLSKICLLIDSFTNPDPNAATDIQISKILDVVNSILSYGVDITDINGTSNKTVFAAVKALSVVLAVMSVYAKNRQYA